MANDNWFLHEEDRLRAEAEATICLLENASLETFAIRAGNMIIWTSRNNWSVIYA